MSKLPIDNILPQLKQALSTHPAVALNRLFVLQI